MFQRRSLCLLLFVFLCGITVFRAAALEMTRERLLHKVEFWLDEVACGSGPPRNCCLLEIDWRNVKEIHDPASGSLLPGWYLNFHVYLKTGEEQAITMNDGSPGLALNRYDAPYYFRLAHIEGEHYITDGDVNHRQKFPNYVTQVQAWLSRGEDKTRLAYAFYPIEEMCRESTST